MSLLVSTPSARARNLSDVLGLINPDTKTSSCVGHAPSKHRRCRVAIARHNLASAQSVVDELSQPGLQWFEIKRLLLSLAGYTLCRRWHQDQAKQVAEQWFQRLAPYAKWNGDQSGEYYSSDDDDDDINSAHGWDNSSDAAPTNDWTDNDSADILVLRQQLAGLIALRNKYEPRTSTTYEGAQAWQDEAQSPQQARILRDRRRAECARVAAAARLAEAARAAADERRREALRQAARERAEREAEARALSEVARLAEVTRSAAESRRKEALRQAARERAECEAKARARAEREAERTAKEKAEQLRSERERKTREARERKARTSQDPWTRYIAAFDHIQYAETQLTAEELRKLPMWPTRQGIRASVTADAVRDFFRRMPGNLFASNRPAFISRMRKEAARWHPDKTARTLANLPPEANAAALLISQVANELLGS
ncbi:hypothetical protein B0A48_15855 [Cryoendolithus antarcticus]|uniref:Uncharacterized protein n=1 Tax=Cryoendolithus antarcticus TaxID=1507870 RepID=A0A1V8SHH4_9PEZI|nr:hypothetical protein B0A48_15855 [Cryoendolithus antarcticus]